METDHLEKLLAEIRDIQREHLTVHQEQLSIQQAATVRQKKQIKVYYVSLIVAAAIVVYFVSRYF